MDHLNGIINEALRLRPPVPSGVLRVTPPGGISYDNIYIPGGTTVSTPFYALGRCRFSIISSFMFPLGES